MVSEFPLAGIIGLGLSVSTILREIVLTILLVIVLGDGPEDFVDVLPGFKLKWPQIYANQGVGIRIIVQETPRVLFTLADIQDEADFHLLKKLRLFGSQLDGLGPALRFFFMCCPIF